MGGAEYPRVLVALYRRLLPVLPPAYREAHGSEMAEVVRDHVSETQERRGRGAAVRLGMAEMANLVMVGIGMRVRRSLNRLRRWRLVRQGAAVVLLGTLLLALEDITTSPEPTLAEEWIAVLLTTVGLGGLGLAWRREARKGSRGAGTSPPSPRR